VNCQGKGLGTVGAQLPLLSMDQVLWGSSAVRPHLTNEETEAQKPLSSAGSRGSWPLGRPKQELRAHSPLPTQAQYRKGLDLSKQAAQLGAAAGGGGEAGGPVCPELVAFASTQRAFQAKLTHFYMAAERQRTDLETLLHLHRFCKKVSPVVQAHGPPLHPPAGCGGDTALGNLPNSSHSHEWKRAGMRTEQTPCP
jgi:hypothetical protein